MLCQTTRIKRQSPPDDMGAPFLLRLETHHRFEALHTRLPPVASPLFRPAAPSRPLVRPVAPSLPSAPLRSFVAPGLPPLPARRCRSCHFTKGPAPLRLGGGGAPAHRRSRSFVIGGPSAPAAPQGITRRSLTAFTADRHPRKVTKVHLLPPAAGPAPPFRRLPVRTPPLELQLPFHLR